LKLNRRLKLNYTDFSGKGFQMIMANGDLISSRKVFTSFLISWLCMILLISHATCAFCAQRLNKSVLLLKVVEIFHLPKILLFYFFSFPFRIVIFVSSGTAEPCSFFLCSELFQETKCSVLLFCRRDFLSVRDAERAAAQSVVVVQAVFARRAGQARFLRVGPKRFSPERQVGGAAGRYAH
jgi:hypothetical protein